MYTREVELSGHIIDSLIIPKALDLIMDMGGDFEILEFKVGKLKKDTSYAKLQVKGKSEEHLGEILDELSEIGAVVVEINKVEFKASPKDKTFPDEFYSTTNHPTYVRFDNRWIQVENIEMDCAIVLDTEELRAYCKPLAHIKEGDNIVVGREGIRVVPPERPRGKLGVFEFMSSDASTEKPFKSIMSKTAREIKRIKDKGGKIALVG